MHELMVCEHFKFLDTPSFIDAIERIKLITNSQTFYTVKNIYLKEKPESTLSFLSKIV